MFMFAKVYWFEAPDMWGKTTQINKIKEELEKRDFKVLVLKNPGGDGLCGELRSILLDIDKNKQEMSYITRRLLQQADYFEKLKIISENITNYDFILCDRCTLISDMVYGFMLEEDKYIKSLKRKAYEEFLRINQISYEMTANKISYYPHINNLFLGTIEKDDLIKRINNISREDKPTIYDVADVSFKTKIMESYDKIVSAYLNIINDEDTFTIKTALSNFDFIGLFRSFGDDEEKITKNMLELILSSKQKK